MSVAKRQIGEIYGILNDVLGEEIGDQARVEDTIQGLLLRLKKTEAYRKNQSFHDTIKRLESYHQTKGLQ